MKFAHYAAALVALISGFAASDASARTEAFVSTVVNFRAGPSTDFPIITQVRKDQPITILGCLDRSTWCEVEAKGERGWMSGRYVRLGANYQTLEENGAVAGIPVITFDKDIYWNDHYQNKSFFRK